MNCRLATCEILSPCPLSFWLKPYRNMLRERNMRSKSDCAKGKKMKDQATLDTSAHQLVGHQPWRHVDHTRFLLRHLPSRHWPRFSDYLPWTLLTTLTTLSHLLTAPEDLKSKKVAILSDWPIRLGLQQVHFLVHQKPRRKLCRFLCCRILVSDPW